MKHQANKIFRQLIRQLIIDRHYIEWMADKGEYFFMQVKEIIFFDELGFGWVVDRAIIRMIHDNSSQEEIIIEKTLAELLRSTR
ncbi:MAG: hypothetical protein GY874_07605 [Desulfobacteraceae bacterium]|nr:hypothetical protein [Desulfobacteraceae bacterium]